MMAQLMAERYDPGTSVAKLTMPRGINATFVQRWRQLARTGNSVIVIFVLLLLLLLLLAVPADPAEYVDVFLAFRQSVTGGGAAACRALVVGRRQLSWPHNRTWLTANWRAVRKSH